MPKADAFLNELIEEKILKVNTGMPCKVVTFVNGKATVQPLFMKKFKGSEPRMRPVIQEVPVLKHRFQIDGVEKEYAPVYKKGDVVYVVFAQRALDNVLSGEIAYPEYNRHHAIQDAVIVGLMS